MTGSVRRTIIGLCLATAAVLAAPGAAFGQNGMWDPVAAPPAQNRQGAPAEIDADHLLAFRLDRGALSDRLDDAPQVGLRSRALTRPGAVTVSLPRPDGTFQRFEVQESPVMDPALAARHPEITTYAGRGLDDPRATVRADSTPLGFHASVRSPDGAWYVDPYYHLDDSVYVSYYGRDLVADPNAGFVERGPEGETDPLDLGALAVPVGAEVKLRTYRLALLTDPTYATYFGGPQNVTAAKVTLMNRVDQIYEDETAIRMILIADNDKLNLNTPGDMTGADGPCGAAACYTAAQATSCGSSTLNRTRLVIGQIIGAADFDIGHIALGNPGGGIASLAVVGGNSKAQGCTGLSTPVGDYFAVDYVAHEMGHQFGGNHTFNGTQSNCGPGNRSPIASVEPGSGSSIMAYAGICQQDNLQPHSDPYWSQRSYDEITAYTTSDRNPINEVQTVSLRDFDGTDSFTIGWDGKMSEPITRGTSYTLADIQRAIQGPSEVQTVSLADNEPGDSYTLSYDGVETTPIVTGENDTAAGIENALQGGDEQQQVSLTGFSSATQSFRIQIGGDASVPIGAGGVPLTSRNIATAVNAIPGFAGTVQASGASNNGFTLTFGGASADTDVPAIAIVNCTGTCVATVRETAKGGDAIASWPAGATVSASTPTPAGYTLTLSGTLQGTDVDELAVTDANGLTGTVAETAAGAPGLLPPRATATVAPWSGTGILDDTGFQVAFGAGLAGADQPPISLDVTGGSAFVGETAQGGPIENQGYIVTDTGNHAPVVETAPAFTIPLRTPFALTGSASDADGDPLTYMWEQNDRGGTNGTSLVNDVKVDGPLFRQFGTAANVSATDALLSPSPGLNAVDDNPRRLFPDMGQILAGNTNAVAGTCPPAPPAPATVRDDIRDCYSEFLPTADWVGIANDRTLHFRLTARDHHPGGGGIGSAATELALDATAGPFLVTSQGTAATLRAGSEQTVTWDVAGTAEAPVGATDVKISLTSGEVLATATPNDGLATVTVPNVAAHDVRIKVEAVGNVFFDVSDADLTIQAAPDITVTDPTVQYSDAVTGTVVKATDADSAGSALTATASGLPAGLALAGESTSEHARTWTLAGNVTAAPGTYAGSVTVTDGDGEAVTAPLTVTVTPEDADVAYAGDTLTAGSTVLRATIADHADGAPGDLAHATVTFKEGATTLCGPLPAARGAASCTVTLPPGSHAITAAAGGHYQGSAAATVRVVTPDKKAHVAAVAPVRVTASAGTYAADHGTSLTFAFDVAAKKRAPKGVGEIVYLHDGRVFRISADRFQSPATADGRAELRASADVWDHSRLLWPTRVARDVTLHVALTKSAVAISLWDGDTLLFSLPEHRLDGGVVLIS